MQVRHAHAGWYSLGNGVRRSLLNAFPLYGLALDYDRFYAQLFAPLEQEHGPVDPESIVSIIGFDVGGPLNFSTIHAHRDDIPTTYVSCELAVRDDQQPSDFGRYELLATCSSEQWVRSTLSDIGRMSLEASFGHGHTLDIGPWVEADETIQGIVFERVCSVVIDRESYGVLRCIGITRPELDYAHTHGGRAILKRLRGAGIHPDTIMDRASLRL